MKNKVETIILAFFSRRPAYGYELKKTMDLILGRTGSLNNNALYPSLRSLEEAGLIRRTKSRADTASARIMYRLTDDGARALRSRVRGFDESEAAADDAFFFHFAFFDLLDASERRRVLDLRLAALEKHLARHEDLTRNYRSFLDSPWLARILEYQQRRVSEEIEWVKGLIAESNDGARKEGKR